MGVQLLKDPDIFPSDEVLKSALGRSYSAFTTFIEKLRDYGIEREWHYYNDGKNWLGKNLYKKKNLFWLSVWDGHFKTTFYFTEKTRAGVEELPISEELKRQFSNTKTMGRLVPLLVTVRKKADLDDVFALIAYKQSIK